MDHTCFVCVFNRLWASQQRVAVYYIIMNIDLVNFTSLLRLHHETTVKPKSASTGGRPWRVSGDSDIGGYSLCRQKPQYPGTMPSCTSTLHVGKNFGMSASCQVADTSYRSMQAPVQYILYFSKIRLYVHTYLAMKKGTFSFNQCAYICTVYCLCVCT